jgi:predicted nucleic acid-binding protein
MTTERGLLDTSVAVGLGQVDIQKLPAEMAVSTLTLAELASGPVAAADPIEQARRMEHVQRIESSFEALPFDAHCARAFARVYAAIAAAGRKPRGSRTIDLLIASTALAHRLPIYTLNAVDLRGLDDRIEIVDLA